MPHRLQLPIAVLAALLVSGTLYACGSSSGAGGEDGRSIDVVATTTQIADLVRNVGGDRVSMTQVMKPGSDPHSFEPRPSDVAAAATASLIFSNGQDLDAWAEQLAKDSGGDAELVDLSAELPQLLPAEAHEGHEDEPGQAHDDHTDDEEAAHEEEDHAHDEEGHTHDSEFDPHWWHDPRNAAAAVTAIAEHLSEADADGADEYERNAAEYGKRVERVDRQIEACLDQIPVGQRKLVTDHEAFGYFADRYGLEVIGAVIPALTTEAQPSARDLSRLAEEIEHEQIRAIFPESSVSPKLVQAIASQTGASADHTLYGDSLGPADSDGGTYLEMMATNAKAIADGLGGGEVRCEIDTGQ